MPAHARAGFGIVEIIVALGIFVIISTVSVVSILQSAHLEQVSSDQVAANEYRLEAVEAVRSIRNQGWTNMSTGTFGLTNTTGVWSLSGTQNTFGKFTRTVTLSDVYRSAGIIVSSGGILDPDTKKATVAINWTNTKGKPQTTQEVVYLSNYKAPIPCADWTSPVLEAQHNLPANDNAFKVRVQGNYAFMTRESGSPDFVAYDISNPANPNPQGSMNLDSGQNNLVLMGDYAYVASDSDTRELQVIDISDLPGPKLAGTFNAAGTANALGIFLDVNKIYLTRTFSSNPEFYILNVTDPTTPSLWSPTSYLDLSGDGISTTVLGNYAYVITSDPTAELQVINVSNPVSPSLIKTVNAPTTNLGQSIMGFDHYVILGFANGPTYIYDVATPSNPVLLGTYDAVGSVKDMYITPDHKCAFLATDKSGAQLQIISTANLDLPVFVSSVALTDGISGISYSSLKDRIVLATNQDSDEFVVVKHP